MNQPTRAVALIATAFLLNLDCSMAADATSVAELVESLNSGDTAERREASYRLSQLGAGASDAVPALIEALEDKETQVWFNSITALARIGPAAEAAIPALKDQLINARRQRYSGQAWYRASYALGSIGAASLPTIRELLEHRDSHVRSGAAKAANWIGVNAESVSDLLTTNLGDDEEEVRKESAEALASIGQSSVPELEAALTHEREGVRIAAAHGLELLEPPAAGSADKIAAALAGESDTNAQRQFVHSLSRLDYPADKLLPLLLARIDSTDEGVQQEVFNALILMDDPAHTSVPALSVLLDAANEGQTKTAIELLAAIGPDAGGAVEDLVALRSNVNLPIQQSIDNALVEIGEAAVQPLVKVMNEHANDRDHWSVDCLRSIGAAAVPRLIADLKSNDAAQQKNAVRMLAYIGDAAEPAIPELTGLVQTGPQELRDLALEALGAAGASADIVVPAATAALNSQSVARRRSGALALAEIGNESRPALNELIKALNDTDDLVKIRTARAIGSMTPPPDNAVQPLTSALKESNSDVQKEIVQVFGGMNETAKPAVPAMVSLLDGAEPELQVEIVKALGNLGPNAKDALGEIEKGLTSHSAESRTTALNAFTKIEDNTDRKLDVLTKALDDEELSVRLSALEALGELGRAATPAADKIYDLTEREDERELAFGVLAGMRLRNIPLLVRALGNPDPYVREYAADRLGDLGGESKDALPALKRLLETEQNDRVRREIRGALRDIERSDEPQG